MVIFTALQDRQADDLWLDAVSTFRQRVFDNMTRLSIDYFEKTRVGEIMDRFGAITQITMWLMSLTEGTLASILQMFFILAVLALKAPVDRAHHGRRAAPQLLHLAPHRGLDQAVPARLAGARRAG